MLQPEARCPVSHAVPLQTLGARTREIYEQGFHAVETPNPEYLDSLAVAELKLETDALVSLVSIAITETIQGEGFERAFADRVMEDIKPGAFILQQFADKMPGLMRNVMYNNLERMRADAQFDQALVATETFRQAYYERKETAISQSPPGTHPENVYGTLGNLLDTGINTFSNHVPGLIQAIDDTACAIEGVSREDRPALVRSSSNIVLSLAKLSIRDFERYVNLINEEEAVKYGALNSIGQDDEAGRPPVITYNTSVFRKMREEDPGCEYPDRFHEGCVGAVALPGSSSVIKNLWETYVGALEKAGFWENEDGIFTRESID